MSALTTRRFWISSAERAAKTGAQVAAALLTADGINVLSLDWRATGVTVALATALSVLTSIASAPVGPDGSPSLVGEPPKEPAALLEDEPGEHALDGRPRPGGDDERPVSLFEPPNR